MRSNQLNYVPWENQKAEGTKQKAETASALDHPLAASAIRLLRTSLCLLPISYCSLVGGIRLERMTFCL